MKEDILNIETVHQCNCCLGCKTLHPLVSVIDLSKADMRQCAIRLAFYSILLIEGKSEEFRYGRKYYDYSNASFLFSTPGQSIRIDESGMFPPKGWLLVFHPDLLCRTSLGEHINQYTFFFYQHNEALHLSQREKNKAIQCLCDIGEELEHAIDCHSKILITRHIELLLDYCSRFYERQFITRNEANRLLLKKTDKLLERYIRSGQLEKGRMPSAGYCADILHLSPHYFNDLLKFETGKNLHEYCQQKQIEVSKAMLLEKQNTITEIAGRLGFPNVQIFCRLFKKLTGVAPNEYRFTQN